MKSMQRYRRSLKRKIGSVLDEGSIVDDYDSFVKDLDSMNMDEVCVGNDRFRICNMHSTFITCQMRCPQQRQNCLSLRQPSSPMRYIRGPLYDPNFTKWKGTFFDLCHHLGDHLIYNNGHQIQTKELIGKYIVLCIGEQPEDYDPKCYDPDDVADYPDRVEQVDLKLSYEELKRQLNPVQTEVVFVPSKTFSTESMFMAWFSKMPWLAVPFSEGHENKSDDLVQKYGRNWIILDPNGNVLQVEGQYIFHNFGAEAYPFTDSRIDEIRSQDVRLLQESPSFNLQALLGSPERDFLISYQAGHRVQVPISEFDGKLMVLLFLDICELFAKKSFLQALITRYVEVHDSEKDIYDFNIVLVHLPLACICCKSGGESFEALCYNFPWLSLPFNDPICRKLWRIFGWLDKIDDGEDIITPDHALVVIGPNGKFVDEDLPAWIITDFGPEAYPFTKQIVVEIRKAKLKALTLDSYFTGFALMNKDGKEIRVSELAGKNVLVIFAAYCSFKYSKFLHSLKMLYDLKKGAADEFQIIHISLDSSEFSFEKCATNMPWLMVHPFDQKLLLQLADKMFEDRYDVFPGVAAFGADGKFLTKQQFVMDPEIIDPHSFPFLKGNNLSEEIAKDFKFGYTDFCMRSYPRY